VSQLQQTVNHEELVKLLPWYVNGTLDEAERNRVRRHIEECAECRDNTEMFGNVRHAIRNGSPAPLVPSPDKQRLLAALDHDGRRSIPRNWPWLAAAATIAAVAITAIWQLGTRPAAQPVLFETVTSPVVDQPINYVLEVQFVPGTAADAHGAFFESIGASELAVPLNDRSYRVALGLGTVTLADLEQYADRIESRPEVASARFVAVQLPVE
jgi:hypothetical protein